MLPDRTTTIGDGESEITERPFHICVGVKLASWRIGGSRVATHHEGSGKNQAKVEDLRGGLPGVLEGGQHVGPIVLGFDRGVLVMVFKPVFRDTGQLILGVSGDGS